MRILIVGYGRMGQRRARACLALGHDVHVVEPDAARCPPFNYSRLEDAPSCDAAFICTPAETHGNVATSPGLPHRKCIEKPLDVTHERGRAFQTLTADESAVCVAYSWRFHPVVRNFRAAIAASGDLRVLRFTCFAPKRLWSAPPKPGQLWPECSHEVDLSLWLTQAPADISELLSSQTDERVVASWQSLGPDSVGVETHGYWSIEDTLPGNRRIFEAITSTERIVMATDTIDESVYDAETAAILAWWDGAEDDRICTLAQAQRVLEVVA